MLGWSSFTARFTGERIGHKPREEVYTEGGWPATATRRGVAGRQDRPAGDCDHPQPDLRGGLSRLFVCVPSRTRRTPGAGRAERGHLSETSELDTRCGYSWILRSPEPRVDDEVRRASSGRQTRTSADHKWLKAGVSEEGQWQETTAGTPQGAVISPLLANVYLHYAFDLWAEAWRRKVASGEMMVVRYADDLVVGFEQREDAERFLREFQERLASFALELHPEKTRLIEFGRFAQVNRKQRGEGKSEAFTFLGFTHYCSMDTRGHFVIRRRTVPQRMRATLHAIKAKLRQRMHEPVNGVGAWLKRVVSGYYRYHALPDNQRALWRFRDRLCDMWRSMLGRRSQRSRPSWKRIRPTFERWLPRPMILHPYPACSLTPLIQGRSRVR